MSIQLACFETIFLNCILALTFELVLSFLGMRLYYMSTSGQSCLSYSNVTVIKDYGACIARTTGLCHDSGKTSFDKAQKGSSLPPKYSSELTLVNQFYLALVC